MVSENRETMSIFQLRQIIICCASALSILFSNLLLKCNKTQGADFYCKLLFIIQHDCEYGKNNRNVNENPENNQHLVSYKLPQYSFMFHALRGRSPRFGRVLYRHEGVMMMMAEVDQHNSS